MKQTPYKPGITLDSLSPQGPTRLTEEVVKMWIKEALDRYRCVLFCKWSFLLTFLDMKPEGPTLRFQMLVCCSSKCGETLFLLFFVIRKSVKSRTWRYLISNTVQSDEVAIEKFQKLILLSCVFSSDRIGIPDYALESAGASIVTSRCSPSFQHKTALFSFFGVPIYYNTNGPRFIIRPGVMPGECWAFKVI